MILNEETLENEFSTVNYKELFKQFLDEHQHVFTKQGNMYQYTIYASYDDAFTAEDAREIVESSSDVEETIDSYFDPDTWMYAENEVNDLFFDWLDEKNIARPDTDAMIEVQDMGIVSYSIDYDHYLNEEYKARIIVDTGDGNYDFTLNPSYYNNYQGESGGEGEGIGPKASLAWLAQTQGYSIDQLKAALKDGDIKDPSGFLQSVRQEAANVTSSMNALVILVKASLKQMVNWKHNPSAINISTECSGKGIGLFDAWNGGGSVLEIELEKPFTIPAEFIREFNVDVNNHYTYSVDDVYGLNGSCYTKCASLVKNEDFRVNSQGRRRPTTYQSHRKVLEKPLSLKVYDGLETAGYEVFASDRAYGFEISNKLQPLDKAIDLLQNLGVKFDKKLFGKREYLTIFLPDDSKAVDDYFARTDRGEKEAVNESVNTFNPMEHNETFRYQLLSRMASDCKYFLGYGNGAEKHLWADTVEEHIDIMKQLYNSFNEKPEWLTFDEILEFEKQMKAVKLHKNEEFDVLPNEDAECACGNMSNTDGFHPCNKDGEIVEPDDNWEGCYKCARCGKIYIGQEFVAPKPPYLESVEGDQIAQDYIDSKNANYEKDKEALRQSTIELAKQGVDATDNLTEDIEEIGESKFGTKEYKYKNYTIEHFPMDFYMDGVEEPQHIESYIIKSPAVLSNSGYHLPLYPENEKGDVVEFRTLNAVKDWIDKFDGKFKLEVKYGNEIHAVIKDEYITESLNESVNVSEGAIGAVINNLIQNKFASIQSYNDAIVTLETEGRSDLTSFLKEIVDEETIHVGKLQQIYGTLIPVETIPETTEDPEEGMHY